MNIKQEAELFYKALTRVSNRVDKADDLTAIIAHLEIDLEKLERENLGLRQQVENLRRKDEARYRAMYGGDDQ